MAEALHRLELPGLIVCMRSARSLHTAKFLQVRSAGGAWAEISAQVGSTGFRAEQRGPREHLHDRMRLCRLGVGSLPF